MLDAFEMIIYRYFNIFVNKDLITISQSHFLLVFFTHLDRTVLRHLPQNVRVTSTQASTNGPSLPVHIRALVAA